jgi:hypothetical protein
MLSDIENENIRSWIGNDLHIHPDAIPGCFALITNYIETNGIDWTTRNGKNTIVSYLKDNGFYEDKNPQEIKDEHKIKSDAPSVTLENKDPQIDQFDPFDIIDNTFFPYEVREYIKMKGAAEYEAVIESVFKPLGRIKLDRRVLVIARFLYKNKFIP